MIRNLIALLALYTVHCGGVSAEQVGLTCGAITFPNTSGEAQWLTFQQNVERAGGDDFALKMLISGQLGSEEKLVSGLRRGRIQYAGLSAMVTSTVVPEAALLYGAYLFDSFEEADFVYDHYLTTVFADLLAEQGLLYVVRGFRTSVGLI